MGTPSPRSDWFVQVPLHELVALQELPAQMDKLRAENAQLRRELEGVRGMLSEAIQLFGDLRREYNQLNRTISQTVR